jgi:hypothetical protein
MTNKSKSSLKSKRTLRKKGKVKLEDTDALKEMMLVIMKMTKEQRV